ncbi:hypothetical protein F2P79_016902 [Pimephales promelas]|nr:hypothetical protein F2P79_016902 [Pimephales promelas]
MSVLSQLMEQQKGIYKEMLLQQQDNFKCFIQLIMDGTNKRLDGVIREVQELKTSLEFTQSKLEEEKMGCTEIESKLRAFETNITTSKQELDAMFNKLDFIENQSRRTNILIDGIADKKGENWCESEKKERGRPRKILVKLLRIKDRELILSSAKKLKGTKIYINEDFSEAVQLRRKELWPKMKAAREREMKEEDVEGAEEDMVKEEEEEDVMKEEEEDMVKEEEEEEEEDVVKEEEEDMVKEEEEEEEEDVVKEEEEDMVKEEEEDMVKEEEEDMVNPL